jgi:taurine--2-oxoglutarate transaminase
MTGFGRTGEAFAAQRFAVVPDLLTFAKGVTSAYVPLGGVAVRESLASHFDSHALPSGHTFSGHPVAMAAGLAAIAAYREERLFERARAIESELRDRLGQLQRRHAAILGEVRGVGAFFGLELVADAQSREPLVAWQGTQSLQPFFDDLLARGLYVFGRYNAIVVAPPLTATTSEFDEAVAILDAALTALERNVA